MQAVENPSEFIEKNFDEINRVIQKVCKRKISELQEQDECKSFILEKIVENDFKIIRNFNSDGPAKFQTYFFTIVNRLQIDWFRKEYGNFRASTYAERLGPFAVKLEKLINLKRYSLEESYQILKNDPDFDWTYDKTSLISQELYKEENKKIEQDEEIDQSAISKTSQDWTQKLP